MSKLSGPPPPMIPREKVLAGGSARAQGRAQRKTPSARPRDEGVVNTSTFGARSGGGRPLRGSPHRDVICHSQTPRVPEEPSPQKSRCHSILQLGVLLAIRRAGVPLKRDLVYLATADEEAGSAFGAQWVADQRRGWLAGSAHALYVG